MQHTLKLGIKLSLFPFFIASILISLGFTNDQKNSDSSVSLRSCWELSRGIIEPAENSSIHSKLIDSSPNPFRVSNAIPDSSVVKSDSLKRAKPDSSALKTIELPKSVKDSLPVVHKSVKDSSHLKPVETVRTNHDSIKSKANTLSGDENPEVAARKRIALLDSSKAKLSRSDSLKIKATADSLKRIERMAKDSTARMKYFKFGRTDNPFLQFRVKKPSSFYIRPSEGTISRMTSLDSTGTKVIIDEKIGDQKIRPGLEIPLDDYIQLRLDAIKRDSWQAQGYEYKLKDTKKDLSQLITDLTNIDIPLPSNPILSIFGKPNINLRVSGQVDIHGAWRNESTEGVTTSALGNTRNEPDFKQQVQINLSGTIGDKLNINADWNTERQFQYENQLKIKYTGYEDEIVQSVEAGNVSLQTSSLVGGSEALFGVKAQFKMGPFSLTALATQKKSEIKEISLSGGSKSNTFEIHAYDYSPNHFFVDTLYASTRSDLNLFNKYYGTPVPTYRDEYRIKDIQVWKSTTGLFNPSERKANAFINLDARAGDFYNWIAFRDSANIEQVVGQNVINWRFVLLTEGIDYTVHPETGFISFKTQIQDQDAIAVAYRIEGGSSASSDDVFYGEFTTDAISNKEARLVLKLIKPPTLQPKFKDAWRLQLRNIYPIGGRKIKEEGFTATMKYRIEGQEPQDNIVDKNGNQVKIIQAFGLDKTDKSKTGAPDGIFDFIAPRTILPETGEIIFPVLQPFGKNFPIMLADSLKFQAVYDTTVTFAKQDRAKDKFVFSGEYSAEISSSFNMGFNVVENSVRVLLNGAPLNEGVDYVVDYNLGQIVIRNDRALVPGADLKVTYEQNDLFTLASKTMLGLRGLYEFSKETQLGFSFLNLNQQTLSDKVRIGEEPLNNSIFGLDFKTNINLPFITKALDKVISTSAPSGLSINAEMAYINPDPNTKKSTVASDDGRSIAYVDDFEGAKRTIPLIEAYGSWHDISLPDNIPLTSVLSKDEQMRHKAKSYWFNVQPSDVGVKTIYGDRKKAPPDGDRITVLDYDFNPNLKGYYNWNPDIKSNPLMNWGGMMKTLSSTANNLVEENIEFIEFWINMGAVPKDAKLNVDIGQISEDVILNNRLDTEDLNNNDLVDEGEDTGIDGLTDAEEIAKYGATNPGDPDPSGDDYSFQFNDKNYSQINATEKNAISIDIGRIPDTEDLNRNKTLDKTNSYFRYSVPLDTTSANPFIQGDGENGWFLVKIPLKDFTFKQGDPSFSVVEFIRLWTSGLNVPIHLRFAEMNLVGNQWQKVLDPPRVTVDDPVLTVSVVNVEDNPDYTLPPGIERETDRSQPQYQILKNEQSLSLILDELKDGDKREVVRYLARPLDVFNYKEMKLFLHGDLNVSPSSVSHYKDSTNYSSEVYLRFGSDSLNFYEYRQPVQADWNEVAMKFADLTAIKQAIPQGYKGIYPVAVPGRPGSFFGVKGNPTLTRISFFTIGILNPSNKGDKGQAVSGTVWVNELRVLEAEQTPGWAYAANASLRFADLLTVNANASQTNPYFHKITDRFGSREDALSWGVSADLDLLKLIPANLTGSNLRIAYSRTESATNSLYLPGTDIKVEEAQIQRRAAMEKSNLPEEIIQEKVDSLKSISQSVMVSETWTLSNIKIQIPSEAWYIKDIFNNISLSFNYNQTSGRNATNKKTENWVWNAAANYSLNFSRDLFFKPVDIPIIGYLFDIFSDYRDLRVYYTPQSFSAAFTMNRKWNYLQTRSNATKPDIQRDFGATRSVGFNWTFAEGGPLNLGLNYNFDVQSTLAHLLLDNQVERSEGQIWRDILSGTFFGKDFSYRQTFDLRANPKLPTIWDLDRYINFNASYSVSYQWQNNFQQEKLGRSAGYSNRISTGVTFRLKSIFAPLFETKVEQTAPRARQDLPAAGQGRTGGRRSGRGAERTENVQQNQPVAGDSLAVKQDSIGVRKDSTMIAEEDSIPKVNKIAATLESLKQGIRWIFFDYDQISINFGQTSSYSGGGLVGEGSGFNNFWGFNNDYQKGPSRLFMIGLSNDVGPRAFGGKFQDSYSQSNDIDLKTSRPLWEGATLDIKWKIGWGINKTITLSTSENSEIMGADTIGIPTYLDPISTGRISRSFLSLPPVLLFSVFKNGIKKVAELYDPAAENPSKSLSDAFVNGFETFSVFSKIPVLAQLANYIPRPNWTFTWNGLESLSIFKWAKRVSLTHSYDSNYSEDWKITSDGTQEVQMQKVDYGFTPLVGLTFNFDELFGGQFQSTIRYETKTGYSLGVTTRNITESFSRSISVSASWMKSGFELPLFGISLKNDLEFSFSYTSGKNSNIIYEMANFNEAGTPQDGKTNTTIEPKIRYVMSSKVTLSIFYRRTSIEPEGAARVPPTTTNEAGLDVRISIQ